MAATGNMAPCATTGDEPAAHERVLPDAAGGEPGAAAGPPDLRVSTVHYGRGVEALPTDPFDRFADQQQRLSTAATAARNRRLS